MAALQAFGSPRIDVVDNSSLQSADIRCFLPKRSVQALRIALHAADTACPWADPCSTAACAVAKVGTKHPRLIDL